MGLVSRSVQWPEGAVDAAVVELKHGCVSCTLREDVLPTIVELAGRDAVGGVVLVLPAVEPMGFLEAFYCVVLDDAGRTASDHLEIDAVVAVVDSSRLVPWLLAGGRLPDLGMAIGDDDDRTLAEVLVGQIEVAEVVVAAGVTDVELSVLALLNPDVRCLPDLTAGCGQHFIWERTLERSDCALPAAVAGEGVHERAWGFVWISDRPFHPGRLYDCLEDLGLALRGRGTIHLASRPGVAVEWDNVGSRIALGAQSARDTTGVTAVSFVGVDGQEAAIRARLAEATLSDAEMAAGDDVWRTWPDPFIDVWPAPIDAEEA